jgi:hypothetical protein
MWVNLGSTPTGSIQIATTSLITYSGNRNGLFISRRDGLNSNESFRDGVSLGTNVAAFNPPTVPFYLNATNSSGSAAFFAPHGVNFAFISGQAWDNSHVAVITSEYSSLKTALGIP